MSGTPNGARAFLQSQGVKPEYFNGRAYSVEQVVTVVDDLLARISGLQLTSDIQEFVAQYSEVKVAATPAAPAPGGGAEAAEKYLADALKACPGLDWSDDALKLAFKAGWEARPTPAAAPAPVEAGGWGLLLTDDLKFILGRPNFWCGPYAHLLRAAGQDIEPKAEQEQAAVIHWLLDFYQADQLNWRAKVSEEVKRLQGLAAPTQGKENGHA